MNFTARRGAKDSSSFPKVLKKDSAVHVLFEESAQRLHFAHDEAAGSTNGAINSTTSATSATAGPGPDAGQWRSAALLDVVPCQLVDTCLRQLTGLALNGN